MIIDFHAHAFPESIAGRAMETLISKSGGLPVYHDGTVAGLLGAMDRAGISVAVVCSIATKPGQFENILKWSQAIRSPRIIPLGSVHPHCPDFTRAVGSIAEAGLPGIKLHAMYQNFNLDDRSIYPLYEELQAQGLFLLAHAGYDLAFPGNRQADPARILKVHRDFPRLTLIAAHLGGWNLWDEVLDQLAGTEVYLEGSMVFGYCPRETFTSIINRHDPQRLLFGTDSPWANPIEEVAAWKSSGLPEKILENIFYTNARNLLGSPREQPHEE